MDSCLQLPHEILEETQPIKKSKGFTHAKEEVEYR